MLVQCRIFFEFLERNSVHVVQGVNDDRMNGQLTLAFDYFFGLLFYQDFYVENLVFFIWSIRLLS